MLKMYLKIVFYAILIFISEYMKATISNLIVKARVSKKGLVSEVGFEPTPS